MSKYATLREIVLSKIGNIEKVFSVCSFQDDTKIYYYVNIRMRQGRYFKKTGITMNRNEFSFFVDNVHQKRKGKYISSPKRQFSYRMKGDVCRIEVTKFGVTNNLIITKEDITKIVQNEIAIKTALKMLSDDTEMRMDQDDNVEDSSSEEEPDDEKTKGV